MCPIVMWVKKSNVPCRIEWAQHDVHISVIVIEEKRKSSSKMCLI